MQRDLGQGRTGWICLLAVILFCSPRVQSLLAADAANDSHSSKPDVSIEDDLRAKQNDADRMIAYASSDQEPGKYWIGVECREAPPELKSQLGLAEDEGLVVVHLTADGPAAKAGIKRHDIVVSAGDDKLKRVPDLIKAVNAADGKEISLKVIRAGKEQTIAITPAERPKEDSQIIARPAQVLCSLAVVRLPNCPITLPLASCVTARNHQKSP